ncbi:MAG TPA: hypothetical protein ENK62_00130 [Chromatiales bacterium]|nr:hypothetical protein [Chromatiales bacterium]
MAEHGHHARRVEGGMCMRQRAGLWCCVLGGLVGIGLSAKAWALHLGSGVSAELGLRAIGQQGLFRGGPAEAGGALILDVAPEWRPSSRDTFFVWTRFAAGNALNQLTPTALAPYGGDLAEDVRGIDDTDRSYLLEAWYQRLIAARRAGTFRLTAGIVDIARFIDGNAYANDQDTQFMNEAFVNVAKNVLPNYEPGLVVQWERGAWSARAAGVMGSLDNSAHVDYGAVELMYTAHTDWGEGHYRLLGFLSDVGHPDPWYRNADRRIAALVLNLDQELGARAGAFLRSGFQAERGDALYRASLTAGLVVFGHSWGRPRDRVGIAAGYLEGMAQHDLSQTEVAEFYWRWHLGTAVDLSLELQWMHDEYERGKDVTAWVSGLRANAVF